ncbi:hypothetical protein COU80_00430 [Candidatus Peregrinibacteria bacterium CG10_big_fil_rev_8_21_14_0_10_55_24]|nr:MAG: hypothetical protein COU80_00430 [Candidatus Peregrinibacteria bacterium CG10_big_fil_rev_8_21_14_0_10_55_24]
MTVLVFGARGYLGGAVKALYPGALAPSVDIADSAAVCAALDQYKPDVVINAAGKTGRPNVDWCEDHKLETLSSNTLGPLVLLKACAERSIYWVHFGSGCIYAGDNGGAGFTEEDTPNFMGSTYSRTKSWADGALREFAQDPSHPGGILLLRLRMPFEGTKSPRNLLTKISGYARVLDTPNSLTYLPDFFRALSILVEKRAKGVFNAVNPGPISPYAIMERYREIVDPSHQFERLTLGDLPQVARAVRSNCVLNSSKIQRETGNVFRTGEEAVEEALEMLR